MQNRPQIPETVESPEGWTIEEDTTSYTLDKCWRNPTLNHFVRVGYHRFSDGEEIFVARVETEQGRYRDQIETDGDKERVIEEAIEWMEDNPEGWNRDDP